MNKKLKKLKRFTTASFAIWPFDPEKDSKRIHSRIIIIGLNPAARVKFGENFHKEGHQFDRWYKEGFSKSPFTGSYMTDLISHHEPKSALVVKKWKDKKFKQRNLRNLRKQFKILGVKEFTQILCIGYNTERLFSSSFPELKHIFKIKHPNSIRIKNKRNIFLRNLRKVGEKITRRIRK